jgi:hypothetical protein
VIVEVSDVDMTKAIYSYSFGITESSIPRITSIPLPDELTQCIELPNKVAAIVRNIDVSGAADANSSGREE